MEAEGDAVAADDLDRSLAGQGRQPKVPNVCRGDVGLLGSRIFTSKLVKCACCTFLDSCNCTQ